MRILAIILAILGICSIGFTAQAISGNDYLQKRLRLFREVSDIQNEWISLNDEYVAVNSITKKVDWEEMNAKAEKLLGRFQVFYSHFGEDMDNIRAELRQDDLDKLEPFFLQAAIYIDVFDKTVIKLCKLINKLYILTQDPESYTMKEHQKETEAYVKLNNEYETEGKKLANEFEKTRQIIISIKGLG